MPARSRSPFVHTHGYDNSQEDSLGFGNERKLERVERDENELTSWKERVSSLEQRLRIVEARLEASALSSAFKTRPASQQKSHRLAHSRSSYGKRSSIDRHSAPHKADQRFDDYHDQLRRPSTQTHRTSEPSSQGYSSIGLLVKYPASYTGAQEILRRARKAEGGDQLEGDRMDNLCAGSGWVDPVLSGPMTAGQMQAAWLWCVPLRQICNDSMLKSNN